MITTSVTLAGGVAPEALQYMVPGASSIEATVNGKPGRRVVRVDASTAQRLQADLTEKLNAAAERQQARPCGYFDHKRGAAAFLPKEFVWDDQKGVLLKVEWTAAGRAAIEGRDYTYFSPAFMLGADGQVVGLQDGVEVGSLVNDPAFQRIEPIAAGRCRVNSVDEPKRVDAQETAGEPCSDSGCHSIREHFLKRATVAAAAKGGGIREHFGC